MTSLIKTTNMGNVAEGHASFFTVLATEDFSESFECAAPSANINTVFILIFFSFPK